MKKINEIASENGLQVITTTTGMNGYPQSLKKAIIGFENFEQAEKLAEEYHLDIEVFTKRDGWDLWSRGGDSAYDAFERSADDYGENYQQFEPNMSQDDFLQQIGAADFVQGLADEEDGLDKIEDYIKGIRELYDEIATANDDEIVIAEGDTYVETIKVKTMQYSYDTKHYVIGLIDNNED
ncbi:hypothetical protein [Hoylesella timonensis]|uniref:Uncharacterized protein n=1 Tax=Hoylesella timonensis CRIS 5C-B1 TaxID=679189 RepID=D1VXN4_9BACT|nr:hypothetical protein [Hoylesella timonensis]EFA98194.1 hypothetical protein HMPREF9019_0973 [Hoylesella timonensis CRIS 5C-B1]